MDEDNTSSDLVGERVFKVRSICQAALTPRTIPLLYKGKRSGEVSIETKFIPDSERNPLNELTSKVGHLFDKFIRPATPDSEPED